MKAIENFDLRCPQCEYQQRFTRPLAECPQCGNEWLEAAYDEHKAVKDWPQALAGRPASLWRYRELLPVKNDTNIISMGEGWTPLIRAENLGLMLGLKNLYIKDERQGPTGSFKDRQASLFVSMLKEAEITEAVVASTGNVAISYSAYCARAGIKLWTFVTSLVPADKMREITLYGSELVKVTSTYDRAKQVAAQFARHKGLHVDRGTKSIAAKESMKTVAMEIAEQLPVAMDGGLAVTSQGSQGPWLAPDWYVQAVSGGLGPVGVHMGFQQLHRAGLIDKVPRMAHIQSAGCAPMVRAYEKGLDHAEPITSPNTHITTLATGSPGDTYTWLKKVADRYGGVFASATDEEAFRALHVLAKMEGISVEPATAVAFAGLFKLVRAGMIESDHVVVVNTSGHTFPVETLVLGNAWTRSREISSETAHQAKDGFAAALDRLDTRVRKIAIIEDNPDAARLIRRILQSRGEFHIEEAHGGRDGIELVRQQLPDLIILDLMMPGVDGFQVINALANEETLASIPIIVVSAKSLTREERQLLNSQTEMLLQKGTFTDQDLIDHIANYLT
jgi:threonine synthase